MTIYEKKVADLKLYDIDYLKVELMKVARNMLENQCTLRELIEEVGFNWIDIVNFEDFGDEENDQGGYSIEPFTDEMLDSKIVKYERNFDGDYETYTDIYVWLEK